MMSYHGKDKLDEKRSTCIAGKPHNNPCGICGISANLMYLDNLKLSPITKNKKSLP